MGCDNTALGGDSSLNLEEELNDSNLRIMAVQTGSILDQVGGQIQFGKRVDLFWLAAGVIAATVIISISLFGKKGKRK